MVKAQTTREQAEIAQREGSALFCFACKSGGTISCDGPISHELAGPLKRLMMLIVADQVDAKKLAAFVEESSNGMESL